MGQFQIGHADGENRFFKACHSGYCFRSVAQFFQLQLPAKECSCGADIAAGNGHVVEALQQTRTAGRCSSPFLLEAIPQMRARVDRVGYLDDIAIRISELEQGSLHVRMVEGLDAGAILSRERIAHHGLLQYAEGFVVVPCVQSEVAYGAGYVHGIFAAAARQ